MSLSGAACVGSSDVNRVASSVNARHAADRHAELRYVPRRNTPARRLGNIKWHSYNFGRDWRAVRDLGVPDLMTHVTCRCQTQRHRTRHRRTGQLPYVNSTQWSGAWQSLRVISRGTFKRCAQFATVAVVPRGLVSPHARRPKLLPGMLTCVAVFRHWRSGIRHSRPRRHRTAFGWNLGSYSLRELRQ